MRRIRYVLWCASHWLTSSTGSQQIALWKADQLLRDAWAAGTKDGLNGKGRDFSLPHEVRMFACAIEDNAHHKAAAALPRVIVQVGPFALTISRNP